MHRKLSESSSIIIINNDDNNNDVVEVDEHAISIDSKKQKLTHSKVFKPIGGRFFKKKPAKINTNYEFIIVGKDNTSKYQCDPQRICLPHQAIDPYTNYDYEYMRWFGKCYWPIMKDSSIYLKNEEEGLRTLANAGFYRGVYIEPSLITEMIKSCYGSNYVEKQAGYFSNILRKMKSLTGKEQVDKKPSTYTHKELFAKENRLYNMEQAVEHFNECLKSN